MPDIKIVRSTTQNLSKYSALKSELEAIASNELGDILDNWSNVSPEQMDKLVRYLKSELQPFGLLSREHEKESGNSLARERSEAKTIVKQYG